MSLDSNMRLAISVAAFVRQLLPVSANYMYSSSVIKRADGTGLHYDNTGLVGRVRNMAVGREDGVDGTIDAALKVGAGNCGELAAVACRFMVNKGGNPVERAIIRDGTGVMGAGGTESPVLTHFVAVLGREGPCGPHGSIGLPGKGWGPAAVICDPWDKVAYPAVDYLNFWDNLYAASTAGQGRPENMGCYVIEKFSYMFSMTSGKRTSGKCKSQLMKEFDVLRKRTYVLYVS